MDETWWRTPEQLDSDQREIVSLPLDGSHLVVGPPGSGKTNLLLLRASFVVRSGLPHISVITFNRVLREFLATGSDNYPFEPERVQTFVGWGLGVLHSHGVHLNTDVSFKELRDNIGNALSTLPQRSIEQSRHNCILIDESQDYTAREIELMRSFADLVFAVGDNNQRIYESDGSLDYLRTFCATPPPLRFHYRNGLSICRVADGIMNTSVGGMVDTCNYDEARYPSSVRHVSGLTIEQQVDAAIAKLSTQLDAYPDERIGIMAPRKVDAKKVFDLLEKSSVGSKVQLQRYEDGYEALDAERPIVVSTMHSAKGLEYRATHLFALDTITKLDSHQRVAYTAVTRAKTSLSAYSYGAIPGYLARGFAAASDAPVAVPTISDLFR